MNIRKQFRHPHSVPYWADPAGCMQPYPWLRFSVRPRMDDLQHRNHLHSIKLPNAHAATVVVTTVPLECRRSLSQAKIILNNLKLCSKRGSQWRKLQLVPRTIPPAVSLRLLAGTVMTPACAPSANSTPPAHPRRWNSLFHCLSTISTCRHTANILLMPKAQRSRACTQCRERRVKVPSTAL